MWWHCTWIHIELVAMSRECRIDITACFRRLFYKLYNIDEYWVTCSSYLRAGRSTNSCRNQSERNCSVKFTGRFTGRIHSSRFGFTNSHHLQYIAIDAVPGRSSCWMRWAQLMDALNVLALDGVFSRVSSLLILRDLNENWRLESQLGASSALPRSLTFICGTSTGGLYRSHARTASNDCGRWRSDCYLDFQGDIRTSIVRLGSGRW